MLLGSKINSRTPSIEPLFAALVAQARNQGFYRSLQVPDTFDGRFEMLTLHLFLTIRRLQADKAASKAAERLTARYFRSLDDALRESGVGDLSVARKMRALAENFYGRVRAYSEALDFEDDPSPLIQAVSRNVFGLSESREAAPLSEYVRQSEIALRSQDCTIIVSGRISFAPLPDSAGPHAD